MWQIAHTIWNVFRATLHVYTLFSFITEAFFSSWEIWRNHSNKSWLCCCIVSMIGRIAHMHTWTCTSVYYAFCAKAQRDLYQLLDSLKARLVVRIQAVRMDARQWKMECGRFRNCLMEHISCLPSYLTSFCSLYQGCIANTDHAMLYLPTSRPTHICSELKPQW